MNKSQDKITGTKQDTAIKYCFEDESTRTLKIFSE